MQARQAQHNLERQATPGIPYRHTAADRFKLVKPMPINGEAGAA